MTIASLVKLPRAPLYAVLLATAWAGLSSPGSAWPGSAAESPLGAPPCGQPEDIDDDSYDGTLDPIACCDFEVSDATPLMRNVKAFVAVSHGQAGDLTIKLRSPAETVITLMSRPGLVEPADDGSGCCGFESDWAGALVLFDDAAPVSAEAMGLPGLDVCSGDGICEYSSAPGSASDAGLADFDDEDPNGTWLCCVGDSEPGDDGTLDGCFVELPLFVDGFETGDTDNWSATS